MPAMPAMPDRIKIVDALMRPPQLPVIRRKSAIELDEQELIRKRHATSQMEAPLA